MVSGRKIMLRSIRQSKSSVGRVVGVAVVLFGMEIGLFIEIVCRLAELLGHSEIG